MDSVEHWKANGGEVASAVEALAARPVPGALLQVEPEWDSLIELRGRGLDKTGENALLRRVWDLMLSRLPEDTVGRRGSWTKLELVLEGPREHLIAKARELLEEIEGTPELSEISWHVLLTEVVPLDAERTFMCDPGYDLADTHGSFIAWVEPYRGDDWRSSQRYPKVQFVTDDAEEER